MSTHHLLIAATPQPPYYAVIFTSTRTELGIVDTGKCPGEWLSLDRATMVFLELRARAERMAWASR